MKYTEKGVLLDLYNVYDSFTRAFKLIDTDHYYIHEGQKYSYSEKFTLGTEETKVISFTTPSTASGLEIHFRNDITSTSADKVTIELYEEDIITGGSDKLSNLYNYKRNSSETTNMQLFKSGTTQSIPGTVILTSFIGGGTNAGSNKAGATTDQKEERVLKVNTTYSLKYTNDSSGDNVINTIITWYEEDEYTA